MYQSQNQETHGCQNCHFSQILKFGEYVNIIVRVSSHTQVTIWVNSILNHIDTRAVLARCEIIWQGIQIQIVSRYCQIPIPYWYQKGEIVSIGMYQEKRFRTSTGCNPYHSLQMKHNLAHDIIPESCHINQQELDQEMVW